MPGLSTTAPFGFGFDPEQFLPAYQALGVVSCQFYRNTENPPTVGDVLRAISGAGLRFDSIHGVFGESIDPSSPDDSRRRDALKTYEDEGRLAKELVGGGGGTGAMGPLVVVHPAALRPGRAPMDPAESPAAWAERSGPLSDFLKRLADVGERLGVTYLIENLPWSCWAGHDPAALSRVILGIGSPRVRMCLDTGHAHMTTRDVAGSLRAAAPAIDYLHIHDNDSTADDHRMPGDGTIDWPSVTRALVETGVGGARGRAIPMLEVFYDAERVEAMVKDGLAERLRGWLALG